MLIGIILSLVSVIIFFGLKTVSVALATKEYSYIGHQTLSKMAKWQRPKREFWTAFPLREIVAIIARIIYIDEARASMLSNMLSKAGLSITPREFIARRYIIIAFGIGLMVLCYFLNFYFGIVLIILAAVFTMMKQRDSLNIKIRKKEKIIAQEMPRFVRTISRNLQSNRDLYNVISAYRKVGGPELGSELDILLAEMKSGNMQNALVHFENRLGSPEAFRLCSALRDMSMGIDQTVTLDYMADDMARQAKENIRKELSLRPGKMRRTYYPAIGICIAIILYVLVVYVINNFNNIL